ncbi:MULTISPECIES: glycosyltransferase [unclassified Pseudomonas]|uniref:glycosyltransferase n=1 Tax=unclassified Pseudomonas TaxID=196821 RepID=UPI000731B4AF|nr:MULTISPECIES: glycosyltransferase [unclassified Pseudomonas]KSW24892.1 glycosyltransferase [Pseudomonas sp. ADP]OBP08409.1 glycosyltransferase [Pseudomonas sp. EGD-AKN5]QOF87458.1 glycosyltransferase [Pseudomonas sp. ADPe]
MDFILFSDIGESTIDSSLGTPEYSYFFVLKAYLPVLQALGEVHRPQSLQELEATARRLRAAGRDCLALFFGPPHKSPLSLACPILCVIAWEYDSIPNETWNDDPCSDWRYVLSRHGGAISLSSHTARAIRASMGEDFPVIPLPTPLWETYASLGGQSLANAIIEPTKLQIRGCILDTRLLGLSADGLIAPIHDIPAVADEPIEPIIEAVPALTWRRRALITRHYLLMWYREAVRDLVPAALRRGLSRLLRRPSPPAPAEPPAASSATVIEEHPQAQLPDTSQLVEVQVEGVVYVSVFNPADGRKNWENLVTAFCWAFRGTADATLVLKITQKDLASYYVHMLTLLSQLAPFACRVVVMHGFLDDEQFQRLREATSYYVNASRCEGLCLPLMEFLACGKPAIAPAHTAMEDYVDGDLAFVVPACREHAVWPQDTRLSYRTIRYRPDWGALKQAYLDSHGIARQAPERYQAMSMAARQRMREFAGEERFANELGEFLGTFLGTGRPDKAVAGDAAC